MVTYQGRRGRLSPASSFIRASMIPKSGYRFPEKIMPTNKLERG